MNDPGRSQIGNPSNGVYHVSLIAHDRDDVETFERAFAELGIRSQTNYRGGDPFIAYVAVYHRDERRRLFEAVEGELEPRRRERFDDLVRAFGSIPPDLLTRMRETIAGGKSHEYLASKLNELGIVDGMGGKGWTPKKTRHALG